MCQLVVLGRLKHLFQVALLLGKKFLGDLSKPEHHNTLLLRRYRDEDTFKTPDQGVGLVLTATRRMFGAGRPIPQAGTAGPKPRGLSGK